MTPQRLQELKAQYDRNYLSKCESGELINEVMQLQGQLLFVCGAQEHFTKARFDDLCTKYLELREKDGALYEIRYWRYQTEELRKQNRELSTKYEALSAVRDTLIVENNELNGRLDIIRDTAT